MKIQVRKWIRLRPSSPMAWHPMLPPAGLKWATRVGGVVLGAAFFEAFLLDQLPDGTVLDGELVVIEGNRRQGSKLGQLVNGGVRCLSLRTGRECCSDRVAEFRCFLRSNLEQGDGSDSRQRQGSSNQRIARRFCSGTGTLATAAGSHQCRSMGIAARAPGPIFPRASSWYSKTMRWFASTWASRSGRMGSALGPRLPTASAARARMSGSR